MAELKMMIILGAGGFLGAVLRYSISSIVTKGDFPYGTLIVNCVGSFAQFQKFVVIK